MKLKSDASQFLWPSVILLLGMFLTGIASYRAVLSDDDKSRAMFTLHAQDISHDAQSRMEVYFGVLRSAASFFAGSVFVSRAEWNTYVDFLMPRERYPGIEGMGVIRYIPDSQKRKFEEAMRRENGRELSGYTILQSGVRETYYPVEYFWPPLEHLDLLGMDHGAYPAGLEALERARDSGMGSATGQLSYARDGGRSPPLLFIYPIYHKGLLPATVAERRKAIYGFIYARMNAEEFFRGAVSPGIANEVYFEVFDGETGDGQTAILDRHHLIYDADPSDIPHALDPSYKPRHHATKRIAVEGTGWMIYMSSRTGGVSERRSGLPWIILLAGAFLSMSASVIAFQRTRQSRLTERYAYYDYLTGLPNRRLLQDRLQQAIANAKRYETRMALLFLDLDNFKPINDTLGHEAGDKVLKTVSSRLASCLRQGDTLSRMGGDEFIVLLLNITSEEDVSNVAQKICAAVSEPIPMDGCNLQVSCSIGISLCPVDGTDYDTLLNCADEAMYRAKEEGRNNFRFCNAVYSTY